MTESGTNETSEKSKYNRYNLLLGNVDLFAEFSLQFLFHNCIFFYEIIQKTSRRAKELSQKCNIDSFLF